MTRTLSLLAGSWLMLASCDAGPMLVGSDRSSLGQGGTSGAAGSSGSSGQSSEPGLLDGVIAAMAPGSWKELPGTDMLAVCPPQSDQYTCGAVVSAWSGGALDDAHDRLAVFGGGYSDSFVNSVFSFELHDGVWKRWTGVPAGFSASPFAPALLDKRVESCGLYPASSVTELQIPDAWLTSAGYLRPEYCDDPSIASQLDPQQPRSTETFGNLAFSADGRFYLLGSTHSFHSGQAGSERVMGFDFTTGLWNRADDNPQSGSGASAADEQGHIWYLGREDHENGRLAEFDPVAGSWVSHGAVGENFYNAGAVVDVKRRRLVLTQDGATVTVYDLTQPDQPAAKIPTSGLASTLATAPGFEAVPSLDRMVAWSGGRTVHWLDPATWTWTSVEGSGDDPGAPTTTGTFGRFRYSPKRGVFVLVNQASKNVFLFKPPLSAP